MDQNRQNPRFEIGGQVRNYYNFGSHQSHPRTMDHNNLFPKLNIRGKERSSYNFRGDQGHVRNVDPRFDIGGQKVETLRPRLIEVVSPGKVHIGRETRDPPPRFPDEREHRYDEIVYNDGGARVKKVSHYKRMEAPSPEQWKTIETVKQSIGARAHNYEVPTISKQRTQQEERADFMERYSQEGSRQMIHRGRPESRTFTPDMGTVKQSIATGARHYEVPTIYQQRNKKGGGTDYMGRYNQGGTNEARALSPTMETDQRDWEKEMLKNINQLSLTGGPTQLQNETFLIQQQEEKRIEIEHQLAHINTINQAINNEVSSNESQEDEDELDNFQNIVCSTDPALLSKDYQTRLELMQNVQEKLDKVLKRKSRRLQKKQAERIDIRGLSKKERGNLR